MSGNFAEPKRSTPPSPLGVIRDGDEVGREHRWPNGISAAPVTLPGDRRPLEEYVAARFEAELAPKAIARLESSSLAATARALALLERVERQRPRASRLPPSTALPQLTPSTSP